MCCTKKSSLDDIVDSKFFYSLTVYFKSDISTKNDSQHSVVFWQGYPIYI